MKKILILEDEEKIGEMYKKRLENNNFDVRWTKTVEETETEAKTFLPDLVLIDHGIKGHKREGIELLPFFKSLLPKAKLIMLSNYSDVELQDKAFKNGAYSFLIKMNYTPKTLTHYIQEIFA